MRIARGGASVSFAPVEGEHQGRGAPRAAGGGGGETVRSSPLRSGQSPSLQSPLGPASPPTAGEIAEETQGRTISLQVSAGLAFKK